MIETTMPGRARLATRVTRLGVATLLATAGVTLVNELPAGAVGYPASTTCDSGTQIIDNTVEGLHTKLYTLRTGNEVDICVRIDNALNGVGVGGDLVINPTATPTVTVGPVSTPFFDSSVGACALAGNSVPGTHPISSGGIDGIPYLVDAYFNGSQVSLCVGVASVDERLVVPISVPTVNVSPGALVVFYPDPGTP